MNISRVDLNLLVFLDVLLRERNVTRAAEQLGITQPAMSNALRRLRDLLQDPLLIRTREGMVPTERAMALAPEVREILSRIEQAVQPTEPFDPAQSQRLFRIMASDYAEGTLLPPLLDLLRREAPNVTLDILTPSDVSFLDVEKGKIDMAINRFDRLPDAFHQSSLWRDGFACIMSRHNPALQEFTLERYLQAPHIWVSKTGMGIGTGITARDTQRLGWVDEALEELGHRRHLRVFTRHYQIATLLAQQPDLIATLPAMAALVQQEHPELIIRKPPFPIVPIELEMAWSPLLQHNPAHRWLREQITQIARDCAQATPQRLKAALQRQG